MLCFFFSNAIPTFCERIGSVKHGGVADSRLVVLKAAQKIMDVYGEDGNDDDRPEAKPKHEALYSMKIPDDYCWVITIYSALSRTTF